MSERRPGAYGTVVIDVVGLSVGRGLGIGCLDHEGRYDNILKCDGEVMGTRGFRVLLVSRESRGCFSCYACSSS